MVLQSCTIALMIEELKFLDKLMRRSENETVEFKEAKQTFDKEKLLQYCCALANEKGGYLILGVSDEFPRRVVGTQAFFDIESKKLELLQALRLRVDIQDVRHPQGRVLIFHIPSRPIGTPLAINGQFWMRAGESLVGMTADQLQQIFSEGVTDFSATFCKATWEDFDPFALERFRKTRFQKSQDKSILNAPIERLLEDGRLVQNGLLTYAALILFGTHKALALHLPQAEIIYEYRTQPNAVTASYRHEFRQGFFAIDNQLWHEIDSRNDIYPLQLGLVVQNIPTFHERAVREAILNAVTHRDYQHAGSVWMKQTPRTLGITSPGGLMGGITIENMLWKQESRNRLIAETLVNCGFVERSGVGIDLIYRTQIINSKPAPDFSNTDDFQVALVLNGTVKNEEFIRFLSQIGQERLEAFATEDVLVLDAILDGKPLDSRLRDRVAHLLKIGVIEKAGRNKYMLSRGFYEFSGQRGLYTRQRGLDHQTNKELLLKHIADNHIQGSPLSDLAQVLPNLLHHKVQVLLKELRSENKVVVRGMTKGARWFLNK
jgi:ATP-dependent DNA helicase RecG